MNIRKRTLIVAQMGVDIVAFVLVNEHVSGERGRREEAKMVLQERTDIEITTEQLDESRYPVVTLSRTAPVKTHEVSFTLTKDFVCIVLDGKAVDVSWEDFERLVDAVRAQRSSAQDD